MDTIATIVVLHDKYAEKVSSFFGKDIKRL